jgi:hypothetical protein
LFGEDKLACGRGGKAAMEEPSELIEKTILLNKNNEAVLICDKCGMFHKIDEALYRSGEAKRFLLECEKCRRRYSVLVNLRKHYRKRVALQGTYNVVEKAGGGGAGGIARITVEDMSKSGLGFRTNGPAKLIVGDVLRLNFRLDNAKRSAVEKIAMVRRVFNDIVGVEFTKPIDERDPDLAFYMS